ncbi:MAG: MASE3 domain-containing protein, partial [Desulfuromonadaceae bacterium]|nr:MASE3 domain-containing protein [Desulfuromonadaceae bacterium]
FDPGVLKLLALSIGCTIITELCFTVYVHLYGISNLVGHFFKIFSFYFIYKAIIETGLAKPYDLLFKDLRESEERFKALSEASFGGIIIHDKGLILECNAGLSDMTGFSYKELIGMNGLHLIAPESLDTVMAHIQSGYEQNYEVTGVRKSGATYPLAIKGKNVTYKGRDVRVIEFRDLTERKKAENEQKRLEMQFLQAQKLESLGVLAGGIAHDFNNILMAITGNADLALMRLNPESPAIENLTRIGTAAARAAELASQMLAYSGRGTFMLEHLDLNHLLNEMRSMMEVSISKNTVLQLNLSKSIPPIEADAGQMRQIIMNLVINASEAIGDNSGVITITTGVMECDQSYLKDVLPDENSVEGLYAFLGIADTGCGMDKETVAKLFDPFFTTKFTGRGLGMAAVFGIIRGHSGAITVCSEPEKGTTFKILFPANS